jgi:hypothetical protein
MPHATAAGAETAPPQQEQGQGLVTPFQQQGVGQAPVPVPAAVQVPALLP